MSAQPESSLNPVIGLRHPTRIETVPAVMASEFTNWATGEGIAAGLRSSGWLIEEVDRYKFFGSGGTPALRAIQRLLRGSFRRSFNDAILKSCADLKAKAFVTIKGGDVDHSTVMTLKRKSIVTAIYYTDFHFDHHNVDINVIRDVDVMFTTKSFQVKWLHKLREGRPTYHVPHGYTPTTPQIFIEPNEREYDYDLAYIGNPDSQKLATLVAVASVFSDKKIFVAGNRWQSAAAGTALERFVVGHPLTGDFLADAHRRSRINLAMHMAPRPNGWADLVSRRTFEIPAFRGFMLHVDNPEVRTLYEVPNEIDVFANAADLIQKIQFYLDRPKLRREMIERAYRRAVPHYGHHSRGIEIDRLLRPLLG
ncbi:MAG TPA: glycosyltransferase [Allosphingosinicella sp.]|nr:glycosyltransferase [Allosphingosinicella sp.]